MKICSTETESREKKSHSNSGLKNRDLSYIQGEFTRNLYASRAVLYLKILELNGCKSNNI